MSSSLISVTQIAERGAGDIGAVNQIQVVLPAAARRRANGAPVVGDAGYQLKQTAVGAFERETIESVVLEVEPDFSRAHVDDRLCRDDGQLFLDRKAEHEVDLCVLPHFDDGSPLRASDAGLFDLDDVLTRRQVLKLENTIGAGLYRSAHRQQLSRDPDRCVGDRRAVLIEGGA